VSAQGASTFEIYPAVDLRAGRVVRLSQGDFGRERVYADDPVQVVLGFGQAGARWIHVVDLDGAVAGGRRQSGLIAAMVGASGPTGTERGETGETRANGGGVRMQVAGGLRDSGAIGEALAAGAARVVVGTAAITDPDLVGRAVIEHGTDRIAVALDVRNGLAVGQGWVPGASATPFGPAIERLTGLGVETFVVTAIERDGLLGGPDLALLEQAVALTNASIIASGGIASLADLEAVRAIGCRGAIVGRAIYDGRIDLAEAIRVTQSDRPAAPSTFR
jgi:phosphoribosylformimino-5-aminoimidazole carboxamide ribotide isomerase